MGKKPTLKDVANHAGVSTATVARVLHNRGYVAAETRIAVERAIEETGYRLNLLAQNLRRQRTNVLGHILYAISPNPFYAQVALGVEQEAMKHGYGILSYNVQGDPERERAGVETLIQRQVDAILFTTPASSANVQLALDAGIAVVQVERPTGVQTSSVLVDNYLGSVAAVEHLIRLGHRRIAFIGARFEEDPTRASRLVERQRLDGYLDALRRHGLAVDEGLIRFGEYYSLGKNATPGDGYHFTHELLDGADPPTAIFAACDFLAAGAYQAIYARGLHVPRDISVVGFDDTLAAYLAPPLSTVEQPTFEIGQAAVQLALKQLADGARSRRLIKQLAVRWVERSSTGPAPGSRSLRPTSNVRADSALHAV